MKVEPVRIYYLTKVLFLCSYLKKKMHIILPDTTLTTYDSQKWRRTHQSLQVIL